MKRLTSLLVLCALATSARAADVPEWVLNPEFPGGIAAAECVTSTGALSIDRQQAVAAARVTLAQQLGVRVKAVDRLYVERTAGSGAQAKSQTTFESASQQLTDQTLANSRVVKIEVIKRVFGENQLCVMVAITPESTQAYFKDLLKVANANIPAELENELFESFRVKERAKQ